MYSIQSAFEVLKIFIICLRYIFTNKPLHVNEKQDSDFLVQCQSSNY